MQQSFRSFFRASIGTTTTVTPVKVSAGNIKLRLLPIPVPIIATTGLSCCMIASITDF
jgi:hypothetical protein